MIAKFREEATSGCKIAIFPGSFNPFTTGHMSILLRGLQLFDRVVVAIGYNGSKNAESELDERKAHIERVVSGLASVDVIAYGGLTVEAAKKVGARFILRGIRNVSDFEYERNLADVNRSISGIETVLLYALPELAMVSSSMVRELNHYGYDTSKYEVDEEYVEKKH